MTFEELNLAPAILKAVLEQGYNNPTPIQAQAIPAVLQGQDLLAGAQTGTGKTAAFALPMLNRLLDSDPATSKFGNKGVRALILTPTRELAAQVEESVRAYSQYLDGINSTVVFGGVGMNPQIDRIKRGVDILVATPGRLLDLQQQGFLDLSTVQILVLDEADRMLDMGFIHDVKKVLALVPKNKQSLLFSATFSDEIRELANTLLKNPQSIQVTPSNTTVQRITQIIHPVGRGKKKQALLHIIQEHDWSQVLVFTRTKFGANNVADFLTKNGVSAMALHGNKSQSARTGATAAIATRAVGVARAVAGRTGFAVGLGRAAAAGAATAIALGAAALGLGAAFAGGRLVGADALHHLGACGLRGRLHHVAAGRLARAAPDGLAAHGNGFGLLAFLGAEAFEDLHRNLLLREALDVHHEAFFIHADHAHRMALATGAARATPTARVAMAAVAPVRAAMVRARAARALAATAMTSTARRALRAKAATRVLTTSRRAPTRTWAPSWAAR